MKKAAGVVGLILVAVFLVLGFTSTTPDKYIKSYGDGKMYEYVGGDAYNFIIEASLRGGEISGAKTAIYEKNRHIFYDFIEIEIANVNFMDSEALSGDYGDFRKADIRSVEYN